MAGHNNYIVNSNQNTNHTMDCGQIIEQKPQHQGSNLIRKLSRYLILFVVFCLLLNGLSIFFTVQSEANIRQSRRSNHSRSLEMIENFEAWNNQSLLLMKRLRTRVRQLKARSYCSDAAQMKGEMHSDAEYFPIWTLQGPRPRILLNGGRMQSLWLVVMIRGTRHIN